MKRYALAVAVGSLIGTVLGAAAFLVRIQFDGGKRWERL